MRMPAPDTIGWVDGRFTSLAEAAIPVDDLAFHTGLGLYETFCLYEGCLLEVDEHLDRLHAASEKIGIAVPQRSTLREALFGVAAEIGNDGWLKCVCTHGGRCAVFGGPIDPATEGLPARAIVLPWRRNPASALDGLKTLNYGENALGMKLARERGVDEGLWLNTKGQLAEGCQSNLFLLDGRTLYTPGTRDGILAGVVRQIVLEAAREIGLTIHEGRIRTKRLERATEAFLTSSVRGVRPLIECDGRAIGAGRTGPVTREIASVVARRRKPSEPVARSTEAT